VIRQEHADIETSAPAVPDQVSVVLAELAGEVREGLLALAVGTGLRVMAAMMESVRGAVDLCADHELDPRRPGGQNAGTQDVDRAQQRVRQDTVRREQQGRLCGAVGCGHCGHAPRLGLGRRRLKQMKSRRAVAESGETNTGS
jgi:hypothetical protein